MPNPATSGRMSALAMMIGPSLSRMTWGISGGPAARAEDEQERPGGSAGAGGFVRPECLVIQRPARMCLACALARHGGHWHGPSPASAPAATVVAARLGLPGGYGVRVTRFGTYCGPWGSTQGGRDAG
jgi:hypothetical protein